MGDRLKSPGKDDARAQCQALLAASLGNALEWYDFTVFALFAVYIAKAFFPGGDPAAQLVKSFLAFGAGFLVRPLGAILLGRYGDRSGRRAVLTLTIALMVIGTGLIAVAPTYAAIGIAAPIVLVAGRILQGFSAGGEIGGATALLSEHAREGKRGQATAWLQASMGLSNIMAALVALAVTSGLHPPQVQAFGWRIPFMIGLLIAPVGLWLRRTVRETPAFRDHLIRRRTDLSTADRPIRVLLHDYPWPLIKGVAISVLWTVSIYTLIIYMPVYLQSTFHYRAAQVFSASLIGNFLLAVTCVFSGWLSDHFGRRNILVGAAILLMVGAYPALWLLAAHHGLQTVILMQSFFCLIVGLFSGVAPSALADLFPTRVRATGVSLCYNIAATVFAGFAPAALSWLAGRGGLFAPAGYVTFAALLALPALLTFRAHGRAE